MNLDLNKTTKILMMMMEDNGIIIDDYEVMKNFIFHAFNDDRIRFFERNDKQAGFMIWVIKCDAIHIQQLVLLPEFKGYSFKKEVQYLRNKYPNIKNISGDRMKNGKYTYKVKSLQKELNYVIA